MALAFLGAHGHQDDGFAEVLFLIANVAVGHMSPWDRLGLSLLCRRAGKAWRYLRSRALPAIVGAISGRDLPYSLPEPLNMSNDPDEKRKK
ncbi:hypothetical protein D3C72_2028930 [compost metagenome]